MFKLQYNRQSFHPNLLAKSSRTYALSTGTAATIETLQVKLGISLAYLSRIENDKEPPPCKSVVEKGD
jgi:hypothetical protein